MSHDTLKSVSLATAGPATQQAPREDSAPEAPPKKKRRRRKSLLLGELRHSPDEIRELFRNGVYP